VAISKRDRTRAIRRQMRVRNKVKKCGSSQRISVFRSLNHIYAQIIDDNVHATVTSCSSLELKNLDGDKKAVAHAVGKELAKRAHQQGIQQAYLDRGKFKYHGRVKALVDGLREGGLSI
jgi:large subunit ribosomal protein L18